MNPRRYPDTMFFRTYFFMILFLICPSLANAESESIKPHTAIENRQALKYLKVFSNPSLRGRSFGRVGKGDVFEVFELLEPTRRCSTAVGRVDRNAYICLKHTEAVKVPASENMPPLLSFHPPTPSDKKTKDYRRRRIWPDLIDPSQALPFMPSIHGTVGKPEKALYASAEAYERRSYRRYDLPLERTYAFVGATKTKRGWVLERKNGKVIPMRKVGLHGIDRFAGRDMVADPAPEPLVPAFVRRNNVKIYSKPSKRSKTIRLADYRESLNVEPKLEKGYVVVPNVDGNGAKGYLSRKNIRYWRQKERPVGVLDDEVWIDVVLSQQMLTMYRGDTPLLATLVSTGRTKHRTPTGLFNIVVKHSNGNMSSYNKEEEKWKYFIEDVPFVMYFHHGYALHSAFWHSGFGAVRSHGCINLTVKDAKTVFDAVGPSLPKGWRSVHATADHRGALVRVRNDTEKVSDRRSKENRVSISSKEVSKGLSEGSNSN